MISLEKAIEKAKKLYPDIDTYTEDTKAYRFHNSMDKFSFGGQEPVVVLKEDGKTMALASYLASSEIGEIISRGNPLP